MNKLKLLNKMNEINFNNKTFSLVENSENGKVNNETIFEYKQIGEIVTADYHGGTIQYGKIIAILKGSQLNMLYQCITTGNELKAGKAIADISLTENKKIKLKLNWEWLNNKEEKGVSEYIEN
ncbi:MAG: hypothetical protein ABI851_06200 [Saprospiraceae bacterium]